MYISKTKKLKMSCQIHNFSKFRPEKKEMSGIIIPGSKPEQSHHRLFDFAKTAIITIFAHPYTTVTKTNPFSTL